MDEVFRALADPSRRRLLDSLNARNGQTLRELCAGLAMARQSVSKHLAVLEAANLITTRRSGREKLHYLNAEPINAIADRWINRYDRERVNALADLKRALEEQPMGDNAFVYTTYIRTTAENSDSGEHEMSTEVLAVEPTHPIRSESSSVSTAFVYTTYIRTTDRQLWQALTDPAFSKRYWGATFDTDWQRGSEMVWHQQGWTSKDPQQVVLQADPYRRLSYTWHTFDPAFAETFQMNPEEVAAWAREPRSKVTFEIEPQGEIVQLTVVHDGFEPGSKVLEGVGGGWPSILSNLKTLLETGDVLPQPTEFE
ncbi:MULTISPECIES: ArsR/SmtB family transcription factor [Nocardia]|uniref:ArsR/SmtB family transcription factor n=1 Tax=Nocardia TaxID=1817 RepID=UPI002454865E|nr:MULTISPECIES: metalloregulator ArsR/SmtB family transcription factor [Nocardia]